jgi:hypothetical protein
MRCERSENPLKFRVSFGDGESYEAIIDSEKRYISIAGFQWEVSPDSPAIASWKPQHCSQSGSGWQVHYLFVSPSESESYMEALQRTFPDATVEEI